MTRKLIIGVSGVSNGGKGELCKSLHSLFPKSMLINQDYYFHPEDSPKHIPSNSKYGHHNWDTISSIDMDTLVSDIKKWTTKSLSPTKVNEDFSEPDNLGEKIAPLVESVQQKLQKTDTELMFLDGFLLFDHPETYKLCDLKLFLTLSKDVCILRRKTRNYEPPDPPDYFEVCVWPMYEAYLERVKKLTDVIFIDGQLPKEDVLHSSLQLIKDLL